MTAPAEAGLLDRDAAHLWHPYGTAGARQLYAVRGARGVHLDLDDVAATLAALSRAAEGDVNLMHPLIDCANAYCTVGEMVSALKNVWGEFQQPVVY